MQKKNYPLKERKASFKISRNLFFSFKYAFNGIFYCFQSSRNFKIQICFATVVFLLAFIFNLEFYEYLIICSTVFSVIILELLNSSIESFIDLIVGNNFNKLAQISKDCAAGAVLLAAINSIFVACFIFIPKIKLLILNL